tara:strand:+ start:3235 stop:3417 length:183 start_codon:yes stop_codon:yes gene_type:complete
MLKHDHTNAYLVYLLNQSKERIDKEKESERIIYGKSILDIKDRKTDQGNNYILNFIKDKK